MILEILIAFLAGFIFFPIFSRFLYPLLLDTIIGILKGERDRVSEGDSEKDG